MPRNTTVTCTGGAWTEITDADVTNITFQNLSSNNSILIKATTGSTPSDSLGAALYPPTSGERDITIQSLFPGVTGANRVFVYCGTSVDVFVSHA